MDKLDEIVRKQEELLNNVLSKRDLEWSNFSAAMLAHKNAVGDEIHEMQRELNWKWWVNKKSVDEEAVKEEWIDVLHFTIQALIVAGCDVDEIYRLYMGKNEENFGRQKGDTDRKGYNSDSDEEYENVD